jgi:integrase
VAAAEAAEEPTFHVLASEWVERRRHEVDERTVEHWTWALSGHVLPHFAEFRPSEITVAAVERFKTAKLAEREQRLAAIECWDAHDPKTRGRMPDRPLGNASINKLLKTLAQVLDDAVEFGYLDANPARGKRRRLKATKPRRTWLELHEVQAVLAAAGDHRALLATMILGGLRVGELTGLRWRDCDLAGGKLRIEDAKTEAGQRVIDLSPMLLDELKLHRASAKYADPHDLVFATSRGNERNRSNITRQILQPIIERANADLAEDGRNPVEGITNHSLRRTFCALLYEAGATPAYVMAQMGHTDAALALEIYSKVMERKRDTGARMDALVRGPVLALNGTGDDFDAMSDNITATKNPAGRGF